MGSRPDDRPLILPIELPENDRFGLPAIGAFSMARESDEERSRRVSNVHALISEVYKTVKIHLGESEAKKAFVKATKRSRGKHGKRAIMSDLRDINLLREYDAEVHRSAENKPGLVRLVSERMFAEKGVEFGASAKAIEKHLRRLLKRHEERKARRSARIRN